MVLPLIIHLETLAKAMRLKEIARYRMSAIGTKRTFRDQRSMSAFGGKTDIARASQNVRFKKADMGCGPLKCAS